MKSDERYYGFMTAVAQALEVDFEDVIARSRGERPVNEARQIIAWMLRERYKLSFPHIARLLERVDHSTMIHSVRKVERALAAREEWAVNAVAAAHIDLAPTLKLETSLESLEHTSCNFAKGGTP